MVSRHSSVLTNSSKKYRSPGGNLGSLYCYQAIELNISMPGNYTIASQSDMDLIGYLYENNFDPDFPLVNTLKFNYGAAGNRQFQLRNYFQSSTRYIVVVTTAYLDTVGPFAIVVIGRSSIGFSQLIITSKNL